MASIPSDPAADAARLLAAGTFEPRLSVDGLVPGSLVFPERPDEVAALLAECGERRLGVIPVGSGTKLALGNVPERADVAISTSRLRGVLDYVPTDLVVSVAAGSRFGDVQAVLAEHGQTLPVEPPGGDDATIGGMIATALAGPRRLGSGTLRDLLIGMAVAHPSGTVTKSGGMVVKNVTGFDLPRVYHGSLGTLGVIVSANFKVLPMAQREATVMARFGGLAEALASAHAIRRGRVAPMALEVVRAGEEWELAARVAAREDALDDMVRELSMLAGPTAHAQRDEASAHWWRQLLASTDLRAGDGVALYRLSSRPRDIDDLAAGTASTLAAMGIAPEVLQVSPGLGQVLVSARFEGEDASERFLALRELLLELADHCVVLAAPPEWKRGIDVWGRTPETLPVMRALKAQFDPGRVLNPGRFTGFI